MNEREQFAWLPEALEPVAIRLARADECAFRIGDLASTWSLSEPLEFKQVRRGNTVQLVLNAIRPIPPEAFLLVSEAINHLRASIDNVIWYLVEQEDNSLSGPASALVSMPITESQDKLDNWIARRNRIPSFAKDGKLVRRLKALQPFVDNWSSIPSMGKVLAGLTQQDVESAHPLLLLQAYSNSDKHRSIRLVAARTFSSTDAVPMSEQNLAHQELKVGDPLGPPSPWGQMVVVDTNTAVMVQRPAPFSAWVNPVNDLNGIRQHISQVVIPLLLTGLEMMNGLPPAIETGDDGKSNRERIVDGTWYDAQERLKPLLGARLLEAESKEVRLAPVDEED